MKIPKTITVGKTEYAVQQTKHMQRKGMMGKVDYNKGTITVATHSNVRGIRFKHEQMCDTFWHEMTHAILKDMGSKLEADEKFVTAFSERLNKAILSAKFK